MASTRLLPSGKYQARISFKGVMKGIGTFDTKREAEKAGREAEKIFNKVDQTIKENDIKEKIQTFEAHLERARYELNEFSNYDPEKKALFIALGLKDEQNRREKQIEMLEDIIDGLKNGALTVETNTWNERLKHTINDSI